MRSDDGGGGARVGNGSALGCCGVRGCCWLLRELLLREEDSPEEVELALASCRSDGDDGCGGWGDEDAFGGGCEVPMIVGGGAPLLLLPGPVPGTSRPC